MNILITGGAGYIGSTLIKELMRRKDTVYILDLKSLPNELAAKTHHIPRDITNLKALKEEIKSLDIDVAVHLAAQITGDPSQIIKINVTGTANLLEALRPKDLKLIIVASTAAQLYRNAQYIPIDEKHPITPVTTYGLSKHLAEEVAQFYYRVHSMPITIFRQTNVYGLAPVQKYTVINKFIEDALTKGRITIDGDGRQVRNFIHINDLVQYYIRAIHYPSHERLAGQIFNIAGPEECQIEPLAKMIKSYITSKANTEVEIVHGPPSIPPEQDIHIFNITSRKAQLFFNYKPKITLKEGIAKMIAHKLEGRRK
jgi:UDP-glucose 4-epimerase